MALIHVTGDPRAGKSSYVVARTIIEDMQYFNWRYEAACGYIKAKNKAKGITRTLPPQRHVVHSNVSVWRNYPSMSSYPMSGFEFGAPNKYCKTKPFVPYGVYVFDEAQRYFDSKGDKELPPWVTQAFELHGHIFLKIFLITQRPVRLHKDIRAICSERIHIEKSIHTYLLNNGKRIKSKEFLNEGKLIQTIWYGRQFNSVGEHERYVNGEKKEDKKLGKPFKYVFHGNIKSHYNPYFYAVEMEDLSQDFNYLDYGAVDKPASWTTYKKEIKKESG